MYMSNNAGLRGDPWGTPFGRGISIPSVEVYQTVETISGTLVHCALEYVYFA